MRTPLAAHPATMFSCQSTANHSLIEWAMTAPTPSVAASVASSASRIASIEPNWVASARAAVGPTCRIDRATMTRHNGCVLATSRLASSFSPVAETMRPSRTLASGSLFFATRV